MREDQNVYLVVSDRPNTYSKLYKVKFMTCGEEAAQYLADTYPQDIYTLITISTDI